MCRLVPCGALTTKKVPRPVKEINMRILILAITLALFVGCDYLPFSGGRLDGSNSAPPKDWSSTLEQEIIQLETNSEKPYSVNLWIVNINNTPYVYSGDNYSTWAKNIFEEKRVVLKADGKLFNMEAHRVLDAEIFENFASAWEAKYGNRPMNENYKETYLFALSKREEN